MKKCPQFIIFLALIYVRTYSQNGKIIQLEPYVLQDSSISKMERYVPNMKALASSVDFFKITYLSDGLLVKGYLSLPKQAGKYPSIIFNRGGNREFGALNDASLLRFFCMVSNWGYVVIGSQYRGNAGGEGKEEFGGSDVNDILNLIPALSHVEKADTSRLGMYGWSRGGMMTYLALTKTKRMKAAVVGSGMADAIMNRTKRPEMDSTFAELIPGFLLNRDSALKSRSAVYWADKICPSTPLLLLAGSADWRVLPAEQLEMVGKLYEISHPVRFELFEGGQHSLVEHFDEVNHITRNFLDMYVRDKMIFPSLEPHGN